MFEILDLVYIINCIDYIQKVIYDLYDNLYLAACDLDVHVATLAHLDAATFAHASCSDNANHDLANTCMRCTLFSSRLPQISSRRRILAHSTQCYGAYTYMCVIGALLSLLVCIYRTDGHIISCIQWHCQQPCCMRMHAISLSLPRPSCHKSTKYVHVYVYVYVYVYVSQQSCYICACACFLIILLYM